MNEMAAAFRLAETNAFVIHDVGDCVKSWGRRGIFWGGLFGFALGAILSAIPLTTNVLTFGTIGTLLVAAVECAAIAGGFAAAAAAFHGRGIRRGDADGFERKLVNGRRSGEDNWPQDAVPLSAWPARWAFPVSLALQPIALTASDRADIESPSLADIDMRPSATDAWESGNCGPYGNQAGVEASLALGQQKLT